MRFTEAIKIECYYPEQTKPVLICLAFAEGATVADVAAHLFLDPSAYIISIWSRRCDLSTKLQMHDRVEFNLPLQQDPRNRLLEVRIK